MLVVSQGAEGLEINMEHEYQKGVKSKWKGLLLETKYLLMEFKKFIIFRTKTFRDEFQKYQTQCAW